MLHWRKRRTRRSHAKAGNNDNDPLRSAGMEDATLEDRSCAAASRLRRGPLCHVVRARGYRGSARAALSSRS